VPLTIVIGKSVRRVKASEWNAMHPAPNAGESAGCWRAGRRELQAKALAPGWRTELDGPFCVVVVWIVRFPRIVRSLVKEVTFVLPLSIPRFGDHGTIFCELRRPNHFAGNCWCGWNGDGAVMVRAAWER
jgi:hypothetical protein